MLEGRVSQNGNEASVYYRNKGICDLTLTLTLEESLNCLTEPEIPATVVLKPGEEKMILKVWQDDDSKRWFFRDHYYWRLGNQDAVHNDEARYRFPWKSGKTFMVLQGFNGSFSHFDEFQYSLDFNMPEGTEICAAREGLVVDVVDSFDGSGLTDEYKKKTNVISILHPDGTIGSYAHIIKDGAKVKTGQYVKAGDVIGLSGNVGYSSCPHLHFDVHIPDGGKKIKTIPILFKTVDSDGIEPQQDVEYTVSD